MRILLISIYHHLLAFTRDKQALFLNAFFPVMLLIIFSFIWGANNSEHAYFLLIGIIGMTILNEGLFSIGPVLKGFYSIKLIQYLKKMPCNPVYYFLGLITSRIIVMIIVCCILIIVSHFFGVRMSLFNYINIFLGVTIGFTIFAFIGLVFAFSNLGKSLGKNFTNVFQFGVLFVSNTFYSLRDINPDMAKIADFLPLNPVLDLMRYGQGSIWLIIWLILPISIYFFLFDRVKYGRV